MFSPAIFWARLNAIAAHNCVAPSKRSPKRAVACCFISRRKAAASVSSTSCAHYRLQDQGFDTLEANERLGFEADERLYGVAAKMLKLLGFKSVKLMTNNPDKVSGLKAEGIAVVKKRVTHKIR